MSIQARFRALALPLSALVILPPATAAAGQSSFLSLSLEELMEIDVTSVSRTEEDLGTAAAAVYVITQDDLRRSGYRSIADALRMVPGMQVGRSNARTWSVGSRGFASTSSNKLLVLMDGRSVYSPLFAGVFWDVQDVSVEEVERIEVIRGPGGAQWGANAVNGVINIVTKPARDTPGGVVTEGGGQEERGFAQLQYGDRAGQDLHFRVRWQYADRDAAFGAPGFDDGWQMQRLKFRADLNPDEGPARLTVEGETYDRTAQERSTTPTLTAPWMEFHQGETHRRGGHVRLRWERELAADSDVSLQLWYDRNDYDYLILQEKRDTFDVEAQHSFSASARQEIIWGLGARHSADEIGGLAEYFTLDPPSRDIRLYTAFAQDRIRMSGDRLVMTIGAKVEQNDFTGLEFQPSTRLSWRAARHHTVWASVSRAVRTPTRLEDDLDGPIATIPPGAGSLGHPTMPTFFLIEGSENQEAEVVLAYEIGVRTQPSSALSVDVSGFWNRYRHLASLEFGAPTVDSTTVAHLRIPLSIDDQLSGNGYGAELAMWAQATPWWRLHASYSFLELDMNARDGSTDRSSVASIEGGAPHHQTFLRSTWDLPYSLEMDVLARWVDRVESGPVPSRTELSARVGWMPLPSLSLAVVGQNLLDERTAESAPGLSSTQVERGIYGNVTWTFDRLW